MLLAALTGLLAVLCALVLPFAPVSVNEPTVSWPKDPARPEPTLLNLTAYRPLALDATVTCAVARQVQAAGPTVPAGAVVLATVEPNWPLAVDEGLVVTVGGDRLQVRAMGRVLVDDPLAGACTYTITGRGTGLPEYQGATPDPLDPTVPDLTSWPARTTPCSPCRATAPSWPAPPGRCCRASTCSPRPPPPSRRERCG